MLDIAIIGAGPGGLALALRLEQKGFRPTIYEGVKELKPLGVGVDIKIYGTREITEMGLLEEFRAISVEAIDSLFFTRYGQMIYGEKCGKHMGYPHEQRFVHRGTLQMMFFDAVLQRLGAERVKLGARLKGFEQDEAGVTLTFEDAEGVPRTARHDVVIGADGIKSVVRNQLVPSSTGSHYSGIAMWRGVTVMKPYRNGGTILHLGDPIAQGSMIVYPIANNVEGQGSQLINWVVEQNGQPKSLEDWNQRVTPDEIAHNFDECKLGFVDPGEIIRNASEVYLYPLVDRDPLDQWSFGRVTLMGDAAHAMYPRGGNGLCQALVDARVLAEKLSEVNNPQEAFKQYEEIRRPFANRLVIANRGEGPEVVRRIVEERSGGKPFDDIEQIFPIAECEKIFLEYHRMAGMQRPDDAGPLGFRESFFNEDRASKASTGTDISQSTGGRRG
ncbi:FAD-dependent monooxygenase [Devosia sp. Root635]|uniref:FAD-dependent monooxygenase n=1 Tax=Devosia sp. Root635 TaxID=1736575 RepID=UPI0006FD43FF|nr:FAD-dependent monooxygenase [Devosia sp. Root635]KRA47218.1 pyridine nucleotide-disulfide oxidoreductase [Devosia sp. Root635]